MLNQINALREEYDLDPLRPDWRLYDHLNKLNTWIAEQPKMKDVKHDYPGYPGGETFPDRVAVDSNLPQNGSFHENMAIGGMNNMVNVWKNSPKHLEHILDKDANSIGLTWLPTVTTYTGESTSGNIVTHDFEGLWLKVV